MNQSRKIPFKYEGPIDIILIRLAEYLNPIFKKMNFTPNHLTTIAVIFEALSLYTFYHNKYFLAALFLLIQYFFDCCDGSYARTYKMETKFGDLYDHISDWIFAIGLVVLIIMKPISLKNKLIIFAIILGIAVFTWRYVVCTEIYMNNNKKKRFSILNMIKTHYEDPKQCLDKTKIFSTGTLHIVIAIIIILIKYME